MMTIVVHVDDIFAVEERTRCDQFGKDLDQMPGQEPRRITLVFGVFLREGLGEGDVEDFPADVLLSNWRTSTGYSLVRVCYFLLARDLADFDENESSRDWPSRELVGSLMWLSTQLGQTFPNAVRAVARHCPAPKLVHWRSALGILGYVRRTSSFGITFQRGTVGGLSLQVFADADYASKAADSRSVSGGLVMCGGACVSWFSRAQKCVTIYDGGRVRGACRRH